MEPINTTADSSQLEQVIDERLEKVVQDFNLFRQKMSQSGSSGSMKLEDLVDLYINNGGQNSYSTSHTTEGHFTDILEDFNKFESTLPPHQVTHSRNGFNIDTQIQEEVAKNTTQNASSLTVNINSHKGAGGCSSSNRVTYIRYGDLNCYETAGGIIDSVYQGISESVFGSLARFCRSATGVGTNFWWPMGVNENANKRTTGRKRAKRKYRGVIKMEEETARRSEMTKITNREAAAKAHENKQAHEAYTRNRLSELRRKNEFLKKLVMFLEGHKGINLRLDTLRRTISGPQTIPIIDI